MHNYQKRKCMNKNFTLLSLKKSVHLVNRNSLIKWQCSFLGVRVHHTLSNEQGKIVINVILLTWDEAWKKSSPLCKISCDQKKCLTAQKSKKSPSITFWGVRVCLSIVDQVYLYALHIYVFWDICYGCRAPVCKLIYFSLGTCIPSAVCLCW